MANYTFAQLGQWAAKTQRRMDVVVKQATNDLLNGIEIGPSITRTGSRQRGTIPRDDGALAASLQSNLYGSTSLSPPNGEDSYILVAGAMKAGDVATFAWGKPDAPYAKHVHYGANGVPGTFWIDVAAGKWPGYVRGAVAKAKAMVA